LSVAADGSDGAQVKPCTLPPSRGISKQPAISGLRKPRATSCRGRVSAGFGKQETSRENSGLVLCTLPHSSSKKRDVLAVLASDPAQTRLKDANLLRNPPERSGYPEQPRL